MITRGIFIQPYAVRTESQVNKQAKHTHFCNFSERISIAEHWKLVAESSEHLSSTFTLSRAHLERIFPNSKYAKKRDILSQKRESGMTLKKREFMPESGTVDTYVKARCPYTVHTEPICHAANASATIPQCIGYSTSSIFKVGFSSILLRRFTVAPSSEHHLYARGHHVVVRP